MKTIFLTIIALFFLTCCVDTSRYHYLDNSAYNDAFNTMFGETSPTQDWNLATQSEISLIGNGQDIDLYIDLNGQKRHIAHYEHVNGEKTVFFTTVKGMGQVIAHCGDCSQLVDLNGVADFTSDSAKVRKRNAPEINGATPMSWIFTCEDMGSIGDYDFNDVVFLITYVCTDVPSTAKVLALAAGGILPANIYYTNSKDGTTNLIGEIHAMFGVNTSTMVNTYTYDTPGEEVEISVPANYSITRDMGGFCVRIQTSEAEKIIKPVVGTAPQMFCVPGTWLWPIECVGKQTLTPGIGSAYPTFLKWNQDEHLHIDWHLTPINGTVVTRNNGYLKKDTLLEDNNDEFEEDDRLGFGNPTNRFDAKRLN